MPCIRPCFSKINIFHTQNNFHSLIGPDPGQQSIPRHLDRMAGLQYWLLVGEVFGRRAVWHGIVSALPLDA